MKPKHKFKLLIADRAGNKSLKFESQVESRVTDVKSGVESGDFVQTTRVKSGLFYHDSSVSNTSLPVFSFL